MNNSLLKIAITGPESTGKSDLCCKLAQHYNTVCVPEFARHYIERLNRAYTYDDILLIAQNQLKSEENAAAKAVKYLFCDTELLVTRIWSLYKYGKSHPWIDDNIRKNNYSLFLLCNIDLPWEFDNQREHPHLRQFFFEWYRKELEYFNLPYAVVSGLGEQRVENAIQIIDNHFLGK